MTTPISHDDRAGYLKCVLYDCRVLARSIVELRRAGDDALAEIFKTVGVLKLRAVYDFLHRPTASDTIKRNMFDVYQPRRSEQLGQSWEKWLTHKSINTYFVHLDCCRTKKTVPQPKFSRGNKAVIKTAIRLLDQAYAFTESIMHHQDFPGLDTYGRRYWTDFRNDLDQLHRR